MNAVFLDSSALVKRYVDEAGTQQVLDLLDRADRVVVSRLAFVEITSAVARRQRSRELSDTLAAEILLALEEDFRLLFEVIELSSAIISRAASLCTAHWLRAADAIQLACASVGHSSLTLLSSDEELNRAAAREGLLVIHPGR